MARWAKCTTPTKQRMYVNLENVAALIWNEKEKRTYVNFPGGSSSVPVVEPPEAILELDKQ